MGLLLARMCVLVAGHFPQHLVNIQSSHAASPSRNGEAAFFVPSSAMGCPRSITRAGERCALNGFPVRFPHASSHDAHLVPSPANCYIVL